MFNSPNRFPSLSRWFSTAAVVAFLPLSSPGEQSAVRRFFTQNDGLAESHSVAVSVSPRGNVWVKHAGSDLVSVLDGYQFHTLPSPGRNAYRIYESRTGQLWSLDPGGLVVFEAGQWVRHSVPEIQAEIKADPLRQVRQIPLVPMERDRVLVLLSNQLLEYDAGGRQTQLLKEVDETGLGRFFALGESREGGLWISGAGGVAHWQGPLRQRNPLAGWQELLWDPNWKIETAHRPFEGENGELTLVAVDQDSRRFLLKYEGGEWGRAALSQERIRQVWPGWDGTFWGYTVNTVLQVVSTDPLVLERENVWMGQVKDLATETNGVFWVATSEGLLRYGPASWRTPAEAKELNSRYHAILEDGEERLWFASTEGLSLLQEGRWKFFVWPDSPELTFQPGDSIYELGDGRIAIGASDAPLLFDPGSEEFQALAHPSGRTIHLVGWLGKGRICLHSRLDDTTHALEGFDGNEFDAFAVLEAEEGIGEEVYWVKKTEDDQLWIGGSGGFGFFQADEWRRFGELDGLHENRILSLLEVGEGKIWAGGLNNLYEYDGRQWRLLEANLDRVYQMIRARDGKIWVASGKGVFSFHQGSRVRHTTEDGLPDNGVAAIYQERSGRLWAGTSRGLAVYHPEADLSPPRTLPPQLRQMEQGQAEVILSAVDRWHQTLPQHLLFSWRLNEGAWSPFTNTSSVYLDNLRAGRHDLEVRAMDRNWNVDSAGAFIDFSVVVPWHREPRMLAVVTMGLFLVLFFAGLAINRHLQLVRSYSQVERMVKLRTRELERANQELLHSQKMTALGTLTAGIAHDFNNLLSIIKGSAQIIETNLDDKEKIHVRVNRIQLMVEQGAGIVKSLLGLSTTTEQDLKPLEVNAVVSESVRLLSDRLKGPVKVRFKPGSEIPSVRGVKELLQQILVNLIFNALEAIPGEGTILLRTGELPKLPDRAALAPAPAPLYAFISVEDSGSGIAPEILPRIFEPFFTTKALSTRRGTGLGLSMVYEVAKGCGYGLNVVSELHRGTQFTIILPIEPASGAVSEVEISG